MRAIISHFSKLVESTESKEPRDVYLQKLSLSVSRCIIRPKHDTPLTHDDRFPQLLFIDLVSRYAEIFKYADELKAAQRDDRYKPRRQRTKLVDQRISRSRLGVAQNETVDPDRSVEIRKEQLTSPSGSPVKSTEGQLQVVAQSAPEGYSASPMDMHAPELPSSHPTEQSTASSATGQDDFHDAVPDQSMSAPSAPDPQSADSTSAPGSAVEQPAEKVVNPDEPIQSKGSLSRSTRVRGARGPRPISVNATSSPEHARSNSYNKARQMFESNPASEQEQ